ncbi:hypothetical protein U1Q18_003739 [Sarracenia purpurea var. burkii]
MGLLSRVGWTEIRWAELSGWGWRRLGNAAAGNGAVEAAEGSSGQRRVLMKSSSAKGTDEAADSEGSLGAGENDEELVGDERRRRSVASHAGVPNNFPPSRQKLGNGNGSKPSRAALKSLSGVLLGFWLSLFFASSFCHGSDKTVALEVVGSGVCADCAQSNIKSSQAFSGLRVTVDCKATNGEIKTRGVGKLDDKGRFKVSLPEEILEDGKLKEECFAQLHSASAAPCPAHNGVESSKIIFKSKTDGQHTFVTAGKLKFSPATCTSAFLWPYFKYPPLPKSHPLKKPLPKFYVLPLKNFGHPKVFPPIYKKPLPPPFPFYKKPLPPLVLPPKIPIYKKPLPPPVPIYKKPLPPPVPVYKRPLPPPVPIYKKPLPPPVPIYEKPLPPPVPIYKKPLPPPVPIYKKPLPPPVPIYKKPLPPPVPIYEKPLPPPVPIYKKPLPPLILPPIYKKPLPPPIPIYKKPLPPLIPIYKPKPPLFKPLLIPKFPPIIKFPPKFPPLRKFPPKYFKHPPPPFHP